MTGKAAVKIDFKYVVVFILLFSVIQQVTNIVTVNAQIMSSEASFDYDTCVAMVTKRASNERMLRVYQEQEQAYQEIMDYFSEKKEAMELILDELGLDSHREIGITPATNKELRRAVLSRNYRGYRLLLFSLDGANFNNSDFLSYIKVRSNKKLTRAFEDLGFDIDWIKILDGNAIFYLKDDYFQDKASVSFTYHGRKDRADYYTDGIRIDSGWSIDITGELSSPMYYNLTLAAKPSPTSVSPSGLHIYDDSWLDWINFKIRCKTEILIFMFVSCMIITVILKKRNNQNVRCGIRCLIFIAAINLITAFSINKMSYLFINLPGREYLIEKEYDTLPWDI